MNTADQDWDDQHRGKVGPTKATLTPAEREALRVCESRCDGYRADEMPEVILCAALRRLTGETK